MQVLSAELQNLANQIAESWFETGELLAKFRTTAEAEGLSKEQMRVILQEAMTRRQLSARTMSRILSEAGLNRSYPKGRKSSNENSTQVQSDTDHFQSQPQDEPELPSEHDEQVARELNPQPPAALPGVLIVDIKIYEKLFTRLKMAINKSEPFFRVMIDGERLIGIANP